MVLESQREFDGNMLIGEVASLADPCEALICLSTRRDPNRIKLRPRRYLFPMHCRESLGMKSAVPRWR